VWFKAAYRMHINKNPPKLAVWENIGVRSIMGIDGKTDGWWSTINVAFIIGSHIMDIQGMGKSVTLLLHRIVLPEKLIQPGGIG
jgi:hypothetical protein